MIQTADDTASRAPRLAVLEEVELFVPIWRSERGVHEVVRVLEEGVGVVRGGSVSNEVFFRISE